MQHQLTREEQVWLRAYEAELKKEHAHTDQAVRKADEVLRHFVQRFNPPSGRQPVAG